MSVEEKISMLEKFVTENPALANVPAMFITGKATTPREALTYLRAGNYVSEVMSSLKTLGLDAPPWELCQEFYRRLAAARPELKIVSLGFVPPISPAEALSHIEAKDDTGKWLVESYAGLLNYMKMRVNA